MISQRNIFAKCWIFTAIIRAPQVRLAYQLVYIHTYMLLYIFIVGIIFINLVDNKKDQGKLGVAFKVCMYVCICMYVYVCMYVGLYVSMFSME